MQLIRISKMNESCVFKDVKLNRQIYNLNASADWDQLPTNGVLEFNYLAKRDVPSIERDCLSEKAVSTWIAIIAGSKNETDRSNWLKLAMRDHYVSSEQIKRVYHSLEDMYKKDDDMKLNIGKLDGKFILLSAWARILDSDNKYALLNYMLQTEGHKRFLAKTLGFSKFKFNLANPTGHWHLTLSKESHQEVFQMLLAIEGRERSNSKASGRGDTSQKGNWTNFRNEKFNMVPFTIVPGEVEKLTSGIIEFDYVSTTRPPSEAKPMNEQEFNSWLFDVVGMLESNERVGGVYFKMTFHHAVSKCYFTCDQVVKILCKVTKGADQADAAVSCFSRIIDLENFDTILKMRDDNNELPQKTQNMIIDKLGWFNIMNPLKPEHNYEFKLKELDTRQMLKVIMQMSSNEPGSHAKDAKNTEMHLTDLYGNGGLLNYSSDKIVRINYGETTMTDRPNFNNRASHMSKFLIGTKPIPSRVFDIVRQYEDLVKNNHITTGPIAQQYALYQKLRAEMKKKLKGGIKKVHLVNKLGRASISVADNRAKKEEEEQKKKQNQRHRGAIQVGATLSQATKEEHEKYDPQKIIAKVGGGN